MLYNYFKVEIHKEVIMKYLKSTLILFMATFIFAAYNVSAQTVTLNDVTILSFRGTTLASKSFKSGQNVQKIRKTSCTDDLSGDGRVVLAGLHATTAGANDPSWVTVGYSNTSFNNNSKSMGSWNLNLQSNKNLPTTASFWGVWTVN
jgi:hypothetical protein